MEFTSFFDQAAGDMFCFFVRLPAFVSPAG
jgi:hypothetical protein